MAWQTPKTDWDINPKAPAAADFNRIEGNILEIYNDVVTGKQNLYNAILAKGVTPGSQAFADLVAAIGNIIKATGTAQPAQVLEGVPFSNQYGAQIGTMPNRAGDTEALAISRSGTTLKLRASNGYRDGVDDNVTYNEPNWIAANIPVGISMFGLTGSNTNKKWAEGTVSSDTLSFRYLYNIIPDAPYTLNAYGAFLTINGLSFTPSRVFITFEFDSVPFRLMAANIAGVNTGIHQREYKYKGGASGLTYSHLGTFYANMPLSQNPEICIFQVNAASNPLVASDFANIRWYAYE